MTTGADRSFFSRFISFLQKLVFSIVILVGVAFGVRYYMAGSSEDLSALAANDGARGEVKNGAAKSSVRPLTLKEVPTNRTAVKSVPQESALDHAKKHLDPTYVCPMHPNIVSKDPNATCPICGMKLVAVDNSGETDTVTVSSGMLNMLGVRTEQVKKRTLFRRIDSVGYVAPDENRIRTVSLRTEGWIERLAVKSVGTRVKKGDLLMEVYSPKLVNVQEEFIQALENENDDLIAASHGRMRALGISEQQVRTLERTRKVEQYIKFYAAQDGVVSELAVREGSFVEPSAPVINLVDLSSIWLVANVFERQAGWVKLGDRAEATMPFSPEKIWEGEVEYVYPSIDPKTRSLMVRVRFDNPGEVFKPNMYADIHIFAAPKKDALSVPREALIRTSDSNRVILALGDGRFKPARVRVGIETGDRIEILEGLDEGAQVVVSSQFLIDSESSLRSALLRMNGG